MSSTPYRPQADSVASMCIGFFRNNPDEILTLDDISDKFGATRGNIHTLLKTAVNACLLERTADDEHGYVYSAGADLRRWAPEAAVPATPAAARPKAAGFSSPRITLDLDALKVDEGIPYARTSLKGSSKWQPLFARLTRAGQSIEIPATAKTALTAAAYQQNKLKQGTFKVAMTGRSTARVWRVA